MTFAVASSINCPFQNGYVHVIGMNHSEKELVIPKDKHIANFSLNEVENCFILNGQNDDMLEDETDPVPYNIFKKRDHRTITEYEIDMHNDIDLSKTANDVSNEEYFELKQILTKYKNCFRSKSDGKLPCIRGYLHTLNLVPDAPSSIKSKALLNYSI